MRQFKLILCFLLGAFATCNSQTITILNKGECFTPGQPDMIVMDKYTFAEYSYTVAQCDTLKQEVKHLDSLIVQYDSAQSSLNQSYQELFKNKDKQIEEVTDGYNKLKATTEQSIKSQVELQSRYDNLEAKNKRVKKWRNIFLGTSTLLGAGIALFIFH